MHKILFLLPIFLVLILVPTLHESCTEEPPIPNWIRDTALWWGEGKINDSDFINALQWLMEEEILIVPQTDTPTEEIIHRELD